MNVIRQVRQAAGAALLRLLQRGSADVAAGMLDDVRDLYVERRARGRVYAGLRAMWDVLSLCVRPQPPARLAAGDTRSRLMGRISDDARQAWRAVRRRPLVSLTAMGTLTAGITLAMLAFTIVDGVLLRPLPFPRSHELLSIFSEFRPESGYTFARFALSAPELNDYKTQSRTVDAAAWQPAGLSMTAADGTATPVRSVRVSSDLFRILEGPPMLGRVLTRADDQPGAQCAAVLSRGLWLEHFGGTHDVVGRRVSLSGESCEIVGVMPDDFGFPSRATRPWEIDRR